MSKGKTKKRYFEVPKELVAQFINQLDENELDYELKEVDDDGDLVIEVEYSTNQKEDIMDLIELIDEFYTDEEEENEEDN